MVDYFPLHTHSTYSFLDGTGRPEQIAERLEELGQAGCGITDHGGVWGHSHFYSVFTKRGLHPVLGMEAYHVKNRVQHIETGGPRRAVTAKGRKEISHLTILAKTQQGYQNLLRLLHCSYKDGYRQKPAIDWDDVIAHQKGLIILTGCVGGIIPGFLYQGDEHSGFNLEKGREEAYSYLTYLKKHIEHVIVEICPVPGLGKSVQSCRELWGLAEQAGLPCVLTDDAHFIRPEDSLAQDTMLCVQSHQDYFDDTRKLKIGKEHYRCSGDEIVERAHQVMPSIPRADLIKAAEYSCELAASCAVEIPKPKGPLFQVPGGMTADDLLIRWVNEGSAYRRKLGLLPAEGTEEWAVYEKRLEYELEILRAHSFQSYFLLVSDLVNWSRSQNYWCIARGSCGGSLVCYYLSISQIDPIKLKLPVERFISLDRSDLPDIDLDFDSRYRDRAFKYLEEKYGADHVAQIPALSTFRPKQALNDVARVHRIPREVVAEVLKHLPEVDAEKGIKAQGRLEEMFQSEPRLQPLLKAHPALYLAASIEGEVRQQSIHAAGVVVDENVLVETVGVVTQKDGSRVMACDMQQAAKQGFLKIDALSVEMLATVSETLARIGKNHDWLYQLPRDDKATYEMLSQGRNYGVFQMKGSTAGKLLVQMQPSQFSDLVALGALARPGPLQSGGAQEYIERKHGRQPMPRYHPLIMDIVSETYGVILYQEQVMRIMREVGGMEWPEVHAIRKLVSKSGGPAAMEKYKEPYLQSAREKGVPEREAEHIWVQCQRAGSYLFNQAHAAAYALIGYWSAYLKCHYPAIFCCCCANHEKKEEYQRQILREFQQMGGKLELLDCNRSQEEFTTPEPSVILGGFRNIKGVGETVARKLVEGQPYRSWMQFLLKCPTNVSKDLQAAGVPLGQIDLDVALVIAPWYAEVEYLPVEQEAFERMRCHRIGDVLQAMENGGHLPVIRLLGRITNADQSVSKHSSYSEGNERCVLTLADPTGSLDVWFSPRQWQEVKRTWNPLQGETEGVGNSVYVVGSLSSDRTRIFGEKAVLLRQSKAAIDPKTRKLIREAKKKKGEQGTMELEP